jgi:hypothetical protein
MSRTGLWLALVEQQPWPVWSATDDSMIAMTGLSRAAVDVVYNTIEGELISSTALASLRPDVHALSPRNRLVLTLFYLRQNLPYRVLGVLFNASAQTVSNVISAVTNLINDRLYEQLVRWPAVGDLKHGPAGTALANVVVAVDSTVHEIQRPTESDEQPLYYYHKTKSWGWKVTAFVGLDGVFYECSEPVPASQHDATVLRDSPMYQRLNNEQQAVGDKGYQGVEHVVVPHRGQYHELSTAQKQHNSTVYSTRVVVENSFERVKNWRVCAGPYRTTQHDAAVVKVISRVVFALANLSMRDHPIRRAAAAAAADA